MKLRITNYELRILALAVGLWALDCPAQDISRGTTFADGQRITASELHQLVDSATILPGFISAKPAASSIVGGDLLLMYSGSALYKISANAALYQNTALITGLTAKTAPADADLVWIYDVAGVALKKVTVANLTWNNFQVYSNLYRSFPYAAAFTNLAIESTPENVLRLFASEAFAPNVQIKPEILIWGWSGVTLGEDMTASATLPIYIFTGIEAGRKTVSLQNLMRYFSVTGFLFGGGKFQSFDYPLAAGVIANTNHNIIFTPQVSRWVLVCQTNDVGFLVGDQVGVENFYTDVSGFSQFSSGVNSSNVFLSALNTTTINVRNRTTGADATILAVRWKARNYTQQYY